MFWVFSQLYAPHIRGINRFGTSANRYSHSVIPESNHSLGFYPNWCGNRQAGAPTTYSNPIRPVAFNRARHQVRHRVRPVLTRSGLPPIPTLLFNCPTAFRPPMTLPAIRLAHPHRDPSKQLNQEPANSWPSPKRVQP